MNVSFATFDASGTIVQVGLCPMAALEIQSHPAGGGIMPLGQYPGAPMQFIQQNCVIGAQLVAKVSMGLGLSATTFAADGAAEITISDIPVGAVATVSGAISAGPEAITDGALILTSNVAGSILVTITAPPMYFDWSITLDAT